MTLALVLKKRAVPFARLLPTGLMGPDKAFITIVVNTERRFRDGRSGGRRCQWDPLEQAPGGKSAAVSRWCMVNKPLAELITPSKDVTRICCGWPMRSKWKAVEVRSVEWTTETESNPNADHHEDRVTW